MERMYVNVFALLIQTRILFRILSYGTSYPATRTYEYVNPRTRKQIYVSTRSGKIIKSFSISVFHTSYDEKRRQDENNSPNESYEYRIRVQVLRG